MRTCRFLARAKLVASWFVEGLKLSPRELEECLLPALDTGDLEHEIERSRELRGRLLQDEYDRAAVLTAKRMSSRPPNGGES